ncbi:MAG TPA: efflux RND transporter periplasmic adaptor subunit [Chitinophagaceae bacterium]|nr:efflux RND transporter periplasmic adaptor subunit [Chitinophagaceae bacterium]
MRRKFINRISIPVFLVLLALSCKEKTGISAINRDDHKMEVSKYTCPMHPQIINDKPGACPICGMDLVPLSSSHETKIDSSLLPLLKPVNQQVISAIPTIKAESGPRIHSVPVQGVISFDTRKRVNISSRVAGRIEKMNVKYNYQPITRGALIMEIYSPDLAAAQRELIYLSRSNDPAMLEKARQRLILLGMQPAQINQVIRKGQPIYRVPVYSSVSGFIVEKNINASGSVSGSRISSTSSVDGMGGMASQEQPASQQQPVISNTPVLIREGQSVSAGESLFTVYQSENMLAEFSVPPALATNVNRGQKLIFHPISDPGNIKTGSIGLVEPTRRNGENFLLVRVYLSNTDLQPGQLISANIPIIERQGYWLPDNAVLQLGRRSVVFKKEQDVFIPKEVNTGIRINGMVQVLDTIANWSIAKNANFLVDSESFIRFQSNEK